MYTHNTAQNSFTIILGMKINLINALSPCLCPQLSMFMYTISQINVTQLEERQNFKETLGEAICRVFGIEFVNSWKERGNVKWNEVQSEVQFFFFIVSLLNKMFVSNRLSTLFVHLN